MKKSIYFLFTILIYTNLFISLSFSQLTSNNLPDFVEKRLGKGWIQDLEFSPYGENFAVATTIGIWLYNSRTGIEENRFEGIMGGANAISYSTNGRFIAAAHQDKTIRIWDTSDNQGNANRSLRGHNKKIYDLTYSPDGTKLASAGADNSIRLWDLENLDFHQENEIESSTKSRIV